MAGGGSVRFVDDAAGGIDLVVVGNDGRVHTAWWYAGSDSNCDTR